jgi:hypothetical protein
VTGSAGFGVAGVLEGHVLLGDSATEFATGQITRVANGADLYLDGNDAFIEDSTILGSNSALTRLADVVGNLDLFDGASVSTTGSLSNSGHIHLDLFGRGGSSLTMAGTLTNSGSMEIGYPILSSSDSVTANSFVNSGGVYLKGNGANFAALDVSGATTNNGSISIFSDTEELAGAVGGKGGFSLSNANLQYDSSFSPGQTINETGTDALTLEQAQKFHATISGFGTGDTIDAANFLLSGTKFKFVENSAMTGGTLTLTDTGLGLTASILMMGHYSASNFTLAPDNATGTLVKFA